MDYGQIERVKENEVRIVVSISFSIPLISQMDLLGWAYRTDRTEFGNIMLTIDMRESQITRNEIREVISAIVDIVDRSPP